MSFFTPGLKQVNVVCLLFLVVSISDAQQATHFKTLEEKILATCPVCIKNPDEFKQLESYDFHKAHVYYYTDDIDTSFDLVSKLIAQQRYTDPQFNLVLYTLKGKIFRDKKLYNAALKHFNMAIDIDSSNRDQYLATLYSSIAEIYIIQEAFPEAVDILENWKSLLSNPAHDANAHTNFHNLGLCYMFLKAYDKAEENLFIAYELNSKAKDTLEMAKSYLDIANLYYTQYKDDLAYTYFIKGLDYAKRANDLDVLSNANLNLAVVHENKKDFDKALEYRKAYESVKDSIWNRDKIFQLAENEKEIAIAVKEEMLEAEILKKQLYATLTGFF